MIKKRHWNLFWDSFAETFAFVFEISGGTVPARRRKYANRHRAHKRTFKHLERARHYTPEEIDAASIASDWQAVGSDMRRAISEIEIKINTERHAAHEKRKKPATEYANR